MIKAVLAFEHKQIPATIGVRELNPKRKPHPPLLSPFPASNAAELVRLDEWNMKIVTKLTSWPSNLHRASINSFGYGGANAHAILESVDSFLPSYNEERKERTESDPTKLYILPFSGSTPQSLEARVLDLGKRFSEGEMYNFGDLCHTLANRRSKLNKKGFLLASEATARTDFTVEKLITQKVTTPLLEFGFVFSGQGAQWPQMGREMLASSASFAATIEYMDSVLATLPEAPSWTIKDALLEPVATSKVGDAAISQPLCTAIQLGIVKLLRDWGVKPSVVVGHSSGEIAAAYAAGLLTEAQAIIIAYYRGYTVSKITLDGCMAAVGMDAEDADIIIEELSLKSQVCVACVNSPNSVTVSGALQGVNKLMKHLEDKGTFVRQLSTGGKGYHSFLMKEIGAEYERLVGKALASLRMPLDASDESDERGDEKPVRLFSSVGKRCAALSTFSRGTDNFLKPDYWRANLENPVQFNTAIKNLAATGSYHLIEIGPHSALQGPIKDIRTFLGVSENVLPYSFTLLRDKDANVCMKNIAGELYLIGHAIDFSAVNDMQPSSNDTSGASVVQDLPSYHWTYRELLWKEPRASVELRHREQVRHELLGSETTAANGIERCWRNILKPAEVPWLDNHRVSEICLPSRVIVDNILLSWKAKWSSPRWATSPWEWKPFLKSKDTIWQGPPSHPFPSVTSTSHQH